MSGDSNKPPSKMDVDEPSAPHSAAENANAAGSGSLPVHAAASAGGAAPRSGAESGAHGGHAGDSNAMDTDPSEVRVTAGGSTDGGASAGASGSGALNNSRPGKKYHGPFAKYQAAHPTALVAPGRDSAKQSRSVADVVPSATFDLKSFVSPYSGITIVDRLIYIAEHSSALSQRAYQHALDELKLTDNTTIYRTLVEKLTGVPGLSFDMHWLDAKLNQANQTFEKLEVELSSYKANLIKENVRVASRELGDFHFARGDYGAALRAYSRMRDYCSTTPHHTDMNICQARACLQLQSFSQLITHVSRAEQQTDIDPALAHQLKCWHALALLSDRKFKAAARKLLEVRLDKLPSNINTSISVQDIAVYVTLMALAEFDRNDLHHRIIHNADFGPFLEKAPIMLELATSFYNSQYSRVMTILNQIIPDLRLDLHLGDHVEVLAKKIRANALIQYFTPFSSVDMAEMAKAFDVTVAKLESDLAELIVNGSISARIDSHNKRLHATESDQRTSTFVKAYHAGDLFRTEAMAMLLRVNLIRNNFVVKGGKGQGPAGGHDLFDMATAGMMMGGMGGLAGLGGLGGLGGMHRHHKGR